MKKTLHVQGLAISVEKIADDDFVSLTDIAKQSDSRADILIASWMKNASTLEFLEVWERLQNPDFKSNQMAGFRDRYLKKNQSNMKFSTTLFAALVAFSSALFGQNLTPQNAPFQQGNALRFDFSGGTGSPTDWIGIYKKGQTPGNVNSTVWQYVAPTSGTVEFAGTLDTGRYDAHLFCCDGYQILASHKNFQVGPSRFRSRLSFYKMTDSLVFELKNVAVGERLAIFKAADFSNGQPVSGAFPILEKTFLATAAEASATFSSGFLAEKYVAAFQTSTGETASFEAFEVKNAPVFPSVLTRIGLGSCSHQSAPQPVVEHLLARGIEAHIMMGDNVYIDTYSETVLKNGYENMIRSRSEFQKLRASVPILAAWDDHDYGCCDEDKDYPLKKESQKIFLDFFEEPPASPRRSQKGIQTAYFFGPTGQKLQVIVLDTRYFLDDKKPNSGGCGKNDYCAWAGPGDETKTFLGTEQWAWLKTEFEKAADLRLVVSSVQFSSEYHGFESWANFPFEQRKMLQLIAQTGAERVFFASGDMHYSEVSRLADFPAPYPIYDFTSSSINESWPPETNSKRVGTKAYGEPNAGILDIDWAGQKLKYTLIDAQNAVRFEHEVAFSEMENGASAAPFLDKKKAISMLQSPSPGQGSARLVFSEKATGDVSLFDADGRLVLKKAIFQSAVLQLDGLAAGFFVARFLGEPAFDKSSADEKGQTMTTKILVE